MSKKLIVGNWKMNPVSFEKAKKILAPVAKKAGEFKQVDVVICPPNLYLLEMKKLAGRKVMLGGQDCHYESEGAFTGFTSPAGLRDLGAGYVILGHSERRRAGPPASDGCIRASETDEEINKKVKIALKLGLKVILCVGEESFDEGGSYLRVIQDQLVKALSGVPKKDLENLVVAHEPVWAIGANAKGSDTPENFAHNKLFIRKVLNDFMAKGLAKEAPVLYGGSVNAKNAESFLKEGGADGLLVGRESLIPENFLKIISIANA